MPAISVIIPTYNRGDLILETLNSVRNQDFTDWECVVVDDHSTDYTKQIVETYIQQDSRFKFVLNQRTKGAQGARNTGTDQSRSDYLIFLDSDDLLAGNCLSQRMGLATEKPGYSFYCFPTALFTKEPGDSSILWNYIGKPGDDLMRFFAFDIPWHTSGVLWTRKALQLIDGWDEALSCWQDWDIHVRAVANKDLTYTKSANHLVDSFYRKDDISASISKSEGSERSVNSKIYLLDKVYRRFGRELEDPVFKLTFARLTYRIAYDIFKFSGRNASKEFLSAYLVKLGFPPFYIRSWSEYLSIRRNVSYSKAFRKLFDLIPYYYRKNSLFSPRTTYLNAPVR